MIWFFCIIKTTKREAGWIDIKTWSLTFLFGVAALLHKIWSAFFGPIFKMQSLNQKSMPTTSFLV